MGEAKERFWVQVPPNAQSGQTIRMLVETSSDGTVNTADTVTPFHAEIQSAVDPGNTGHAKSLSDNQGMCRSLTFCGLGQLVKKLAEALERTEQVKMDDVAALFKGALGHSHTL